MRTLIVDTYYPGFLQSFYAREGQAHRPYDEQRRALMEGCFGTADFYSNSLNKLGCEAQEAIANCIPLQQQWAKENNVRIVKHHWHFRFRRGLVPWFSRRQTDGWLYEVLEAQVKAFRPDVLYVQDPHWVDARFLHSIRGLVRLVAAQIACPIRTDLDWSPYDLVISSLPNFVASFRKRGLRSEYLRFAFDERVLDRLHGVTRSSNVVFVGGFSRTHQQGVQSLEEVARHIGVDFWGYGAEELDEASPIRAHYRGEAWGLEMYRVLARSRVALNRHIAIAENYANNMRLFEATGVGTLLVTDSKENLCELFEPGSEVVAYRTPDECVELVRYYLAHEGEREAIASAGQRRTLREHTYDHRMGELRDILRHHLQVRRKTG